MQACCSLLWRIKNCFSRVDVGMCSVRKIHWIKCEASKIADRKSDGTTAFDLLQTTNYAKSLTNLHFCWYLQEKFLKFTGLMLGFHLNFKFFSLSISSSTSKYYFNKLSCPSLRKPCILYPWVQKLRAPFAFQCLRKNFSPLRKTNNVVELRGTAFFDLHIQIRLLPEWYTNNTHSLVRNT